MIYCSASHSNHLSVRAMLFSLCCLLCTSLLGQKAIEDSALIDESIQTPPNCATPPKTPEQRRYTGNVFGIDIVLIWTLSIFLAKKTQCIVS